MQVFEFQDTQEQLLLCLNYDFSTDCESDREVALQKLGRAAEVKRFWNYNTLWTGLRVLVAYEDTTPVGHLELIPIEYAPRPVKGEDLIFIDCLFVAPKARRHGVGSGLLQACEDRARTHSKGLAVIAYPDSPHMPTDFFIEHGFSIQAADVETNTRLMVKTWAEVTAPEFLPRHYVSPQAVPPGQAVVDLFWCGQCPFYARTRDQLMKVAREMHKTVTVREINTDQRLAVEQWGLTNALYINGQSVFKSSPTETEIRQALESAIQDERVAV